MEYSYANLGNPAYLEFLVHRFNFNSNRYNPYYNLTPHDIAVLDPIVVRRLHLAVGSHISQLPYSQTMQVALLELIRHAADDRPHHGDVAVNVGHNPHEINEDDIEALQEMVDDAAIAGFFAAAGGPAAVRPGGPAAGGPADGGPAAGGPAAGGPAAGGLQLVRRFPAPAAVAGPDLLPPQIAREARNCAQGECTISHDDLSTMSSADKAVTSCGHVFNKDYIEHWLKDHTTCPTCREECTLNPLHIADVRGRPTRVPPHMRPIAISRAIRKGKIPAGGPAYICTKCGYVTNAIPNPNQCPRCQKYNAFGGSRKCKRNKKNSRRKSKRSIKRNKTIKRR